MILKQSTAANLPVLMVGSADHITGLTGATLTITASKNGAAFSAITPTVTELANGWYSLALTAAHTDTAGALALHVTTASADPADVLAQVGLPATPSVSDILTTAMTESYAALGAEPSLAQILYEMRALRAEMGITGTTLTTKKLDGTTTAATYTHDSATAPTSVTRAT